MSVFVIKLLAMGAMLVDHLGIYLRPQISEEAYSLMRSVGRFAFPVFAFLIVNGFLKTRDVKRYLTRLIAFAVLSQIPFSLFNGVRNAFAADTLAVGLNGRWFVCLIFIVVTCVAWVTTVRADLSVIWPLLALSMAVLRIQYAGVNILGSKLNVFYTLALGLATIALIDAAFRPKPDIVKLLMQAMGLFGVFFLIGNNADYGLLGVALIVAIWLGRGSRFSQAAVILLWSAEKYLIASLLVSRFIGAACAVIPVLLYNGKQGRPMKLAFYLVYPVHLAILAFLTLYCNFA